MTIVRTDNDLKTISKFSEWLEYIDVSFSYAPLSTGILEWYVDSDQLFMMTIPKFIFEMFHVDSGNVFGLARRERIDIH